MDRSLRAFLATTVVVYLVTFVAFLAYSVWEFSPQQVLSIFQRRWILMNALALFIGYMVPIQVFATTLSFSLFVGEPRSQVGVRFFDLVRPVLIAVLLLAFVYTLVSGLLEPMVTDARDQTEYQSDLAADFLLAGNEAYESEEWARAVAEYEAYLSINPQNSEVELRLREAESQLEQMRGRSPQPQEDFEPAHAVTSQSARDLLRRARAAMAEEDYISAHYWARLAADVDTGGTEAAELAREARQKMESLDLSRLEAEQRQRYVRKREAALALEAGEVFRAYAIFSELAEGARSGDEVHHFLSRAREQVEQRAFFADEVEDVFRLPGTHDVLFRSDPGAGSTRRAFVSMRGLVTGREGTYARAFEFIEVAVDGEVLRHVQAPYAKLSEGRFLLQGIEPGTDNIVHRPRYLAAPTPEDRSPFIDVDYGSRELHALGDTGPSFEGAGVGELLRMEELYPRLGYGGRAVRLALAMRLVLPFSFVILSFFAISAGWTWRKRYISRPPVLALLLVPLIPFAIAVLTAIYHYFHRTIIGAVLLAADFTPTLIVVLLLQALLLLVSLALMAGQSTS